MRSLPGVQTNPVMLQGGASCYHELATRMVCTAIENLNPLAEHSVSNFALPASGEEVMKALQEANILERLSSFNRGMISYPCLIFFSLIRNNQGKPQAIQMNMIKKV